MLRAGIARFGIVVTLTLACFGAGAAQENDDHKIEGRDRVAGATFSSSRVAASEIVRIQLQLDNGKWVVAQVDYATKAIRIRSSAGSRGATVALDAADLGRFRLLSRSVPNARAGASADALRSILAWISEASPGRIDYAVVGDEASPILQESPRAPAVQPLSIHSLCNAETANASYTKGSQTFSRNFKVGPCYNEQNQCMGRCGRGCSSQEVAGTGSPNFVQRFTQECLDHDYCARAQGLTAAACNDELAAVLDDFVFAKDCGSLTGHWNRTFHVPVSNPPYMDIRQNESGLLSGTKTWPNETCGEYLITAGRHQSKGNFSMTIKSLNANPECCDIGRIVGVLKDCNRLEATNTWGGNCKGARPEAMNFRRGAPQ
jgi:hypothetical protein